MEEMYALEHGKLRFIAKCGKACTDGLAADKSDPIRQRRGSTLEQAGMSVLIYNTIIMEG